MTDGRNQVAELEAKMDGKDREIDRLKAGRNEVYRDAADLARLIHAEHWPENTGWSPLDETRGVLSQISNMCVLMRDQKAEIGRLRAQLSIHANALTNVRRNEAIEIERLRAAEKATAEVAANFADEIERLKAALREIVSVAVQVDIDAGKRVRSIILDARAALEGEDE